MVTQRVLAVTAAVVMGVSLMTAAVALPADAVRLGSVGESVESATRAAAPATARTGVFAIDCDRTVRKALDPIKPVGMTAMSHMHDFFGVRKVSAKSRPSDLLTGPTSCSLAEDHSAYWMPTLLNRGRPQAGDAVQAYYFLPPNVQAMPRGLIMLAGDVMRTGGTNPAWSSWSCQPSTNYRQSRPPACPRSGWITIEINFPSCWDGVNVDSPDHQSHVAYPTGDGCPSTHPVRIPQLVLFRNFNQYAGRLNDLSLASGTPASLHADFVSGWDTDVFDRLIELCGQRDCGHLTAMPETSTGRR